MSRIYPMAVVLIASVLSFPACTPPTTSTVVTVTPSTVTLEAGQSISLAASSTDGLDTFTWASNDTALATVSTDGIVTAEGVGTTRITATGSNSAVEGFAEVTVSAGEGGVPASPVITSMVTGTNQVSIEITGEAPPNRLIEVQGGAEILSTTSGNDGSFSIAAALFPNRLNRLLFYTLGAGSVRSAPTPFEVIQDMTAPELYIDFPDDGAVLTNSDLAVAGRLSDMHSGFMGLEVEVNGASATVDMGIGTNGTFERGSVPLAIGENTLTAMAVDEFGNTTVKSITVTREAVTGPRMAAMSGNDQTGTVQQQLASPLIVQLTEENGTPIVNKTVTFKVSRSNGELSASTGGEATRLLQVPTDTNGMAQAFFRLGTDAGRGNNRVSVASRDIAGTVFFCASADRAPADQINIGMGTNQTGEAGAQLPELLNAWVSDGDNPVAGVPVVFSVTRGNGYLGAVEGTTELTVLSDSTGHASAALTLDEAEGNNHVEATFDGNVGLPATFVAWGVARVEDAPTSFTGVVMDNANQSIGGAEVQLIIGGSEPLETTTDENGLFRFEDIPAGLAHLHIEGAVATLLNGETIPAGSFPALEYEPIIVPNAENSMPRPILLPEIDPENFVDFDGTQDVELTVDGVEGLRMLVKAGSVTNVDGSRPDAANPIRLSLNQVHFDDIPMPLPDGASPPFAWTLQPGGTHFDPPVEITYPNMSGLEPGAIAYFLSFNHDTGRFEIVTSASVSDDGAEIVSDPGSGIHVAGWGGSCPPYTVTGKIVGVLDEPDYVITLFANGQVYRVDDDGSYCLFNVSAPDLFGSGGPGTAPDQISDDRISVIGVGVGRGAMAGQIRYFTSESFYLRQDQVVTVSSFSGGASPPLFPKELRITADPTTFAPDATSQATTTAIYFDGRMQDVTPVSAGTAYRVSNTDIITIDDTALITSHDAGPAFVTATYQGVTATRRVNIARDTITTRIEGLVQDENGDPVEGAVISTISFGGDFTTDANGYFSFDLTLPAATVGVVVTVVVGDEEFDSGLVPVIPGGITDVGILTGEPITFTTTVTGQVFFEDNEPAAGAEVFTNLGGSGTVGTDGAFSFELTGSYRGALPVLDVTSRIQAGSDSFTGQMMGVSIIPDGTTDVGTIIVRASVTILYPGLRSAIGGPPVDIVLGDLNNDGSQDAVTVIVSGSSSDPFSRVSAALSNGDGSYLAPQVIDVGDSAAALKLGDFNGDGNLDAAVADAIGDSVFILVGNGDGTFGAPSEFSAGTQTQRLDTADINGDGFLDVVAGNSGSATVSLFLGNGDGTLQTATALNIGGTNIINPVLADVDEDGNIDLVVAHRGLNRIEFHKGNGDGTFADPVNFATAAAPDDLLLMDLNGDANLDAVAAVFQSGISVLLGDGAGGFSDHVDYAVSGNPRGLAAADFNQDDALDLVVPFSDGNFDFVAVLFGDGIGGFQPELVLDVPRFTRLVAAGDADEDGNNDVITASGGGFGDLSVLRGLGNGDFETQITVPTGIGGNAGVAVVDMNGDDDLDLVTARFTDGEILVLLGDGAAGFSEAIASSSANRVLDMLVANINNDAALDVVTSHQNTRQIGISLGNGDGTFQEVFFLEGGADARGLAAGDIDRDGIPDLLSAPGPTGGIDVRLGINGSTFQAVFEIPTTNTIQDIFLGDVDGDGNPDLVASRSGTLMLYLGNGDGSFASPRNLQIGGISVVFIDIDRDGIQDIVTGDREGMVSIIPGMGEGFFRPAIRYDVNAHRDPATISYLSVTDVNVDGEQDLVFAYEPYQCVGVLLGDGTTFFSGFTRYDLGGTFTMGIGVGDLNGDDLPDIVSANSGGNNLSVLLRR